MKDKMIQELDRAINILGSIAVTHDAQDAIVCAKQKIRIVCDELKKMEEAEEKTDA